MPGTVVRGMAQADEALYERWRQSGDHEALRCLLERHRESLMLFLYSYVHSLEDAEELMLDAYVEAAAGGTYAGKSSFKTWLFSIGKHLALQHLRKQRFAIGANRQTEPTDSAAEPPEMDLLREERRQQLYRALGALKEEYRQILILLYFAQMSPEEAGRIMGKTKKQIYHLAERGKQALKEKLERMGFDDAQY